MLSLTNLQANDKVGPYAFRLEVKDGKGQNDSTTIDILVNKAVNKAPGMCLAYLFLSLSITDEKRKSHSSCNHKKL